jgi:tetratricopeptide (TPR) repeat protein
LGSIKKVAFPRPGYYHSRSSMLTSGTARLLAVTALLIGLSQLGFAQSAITSWGPLLSPQCAQSQVLLEAGEARLDKKDYSDAIHQFQSALKLCPDSQQARLDLTLAYLKAQRFTEAERSAQAVMAEDSASEGAQLMLADSYLMQQKFQQAGKTLQKLLAPAWAQREFELFQKLSEQQSVGGSP